MDAMIGLTTAKITNTPQLIRWLIRPLHLPPSPPRHRLGMPHRILRQLRIDDRNTCPPFQVADKRASELRISRHTILVGSIQQQLDPALPLLFIQHLADVMTHHNSMAATIFLGILLRTAKNLGDKMGDMLRMIRRHIPKNRTKQIILQDLVIKGAEQLLKSLFAAGPFI